MSRYKVKRRPKKPKSIAARMATLPERPERGNRRTALILLSSCIGFLGLYLCAWRLQSTRWYGFSIATEVILYLLLAVLIASFVTVNRGLSRDLPTPDQLPDHMTPAEKQAFIERLRLAHDRARPLAYVIFPLLLIVGFDILYTMFFSK